MMTFALNVTTAAPQDSTSGSVWDNFSPLSKLITIACVDNKAQFEKDSVNTVRLPSAVLRAQLCIALSDAVSSMPRKGALCIRLNCSMSAVWRA